MAYGKGLEHERLEEDFAKYVGVNHAVAVGSGGMGLQISMRAMGFLPGDEVIHQVDTCAATALSIINAGLTPKFCDISRDTLMLNCDEVIKAIKPSTKAIIATHMWGNPEDIRNLQQIATAKKIALIEDGCLSLGAQVMGQSIGAFGEVGIFSFGCIKPIQAGEGGIIMTNNSDLAKEMRSLRHWGDRSLDYGVRDVTQLSWNGRMSEISAAIAREQLKGYSSHLRELRERICDFDNYLRKKFDLKVSLGGANDITECAFTQVVVSLGENLRCTKSELMKGLRDHGIPCWHANFELINSLSFFRNNTWKNWIHKGDLDSVEKNYSRNFNVAQELFDVGGIGFSKMNFLNQANVKYLKHVLENIISER
jgi:perosamine synthetase